MTRFIVLCLWLSAATVHGQTASPTALLRRADVKAALDTARATEPQTLADQIRFCEVPAPPFNETARGALVRKAFVDVGLQNVRVDRVGNVLGERSGVEDRPHLVVASHLDTVFPAETDVKVTRDGALLRGPGIGDNCRGLAVLVAVARSLAQARVTTPGRITFVANVGEEGLGDLRGMKQLFNETLKGRIDRFVSIDGAGRDVRTLHVTNIAVGSHRYRVTFKGPGGHSFGAFGLANPAGALGRAITRIQALRVPSQPRTTFNVGRIGGGTSVNAIPFDAWMEVDLRSSDEGALSELDARFHQAVDAAVADENQRWGTPGAITVVKEQVGDRPAGSMPPDSPVVRIAQDAARALGLATVLAEGSTDANLPISLLVPAVTIGGGGAGHDVHAVTESFDSTDAWKGAQHAVLVAVALASP